MGMTVSWNKLFSVPKEGDYIRSIIAYSKTPLLIYKNRDRGIEEVAQYRYRIYLNLWLVEIQHTWDGRMLHP